MALLRPYICALGVLSTSIAFAQEPPAPPRPIPAPIEAVTPAPIEPPIVDPAALPPATTGTPGTISTLPADGTIPPAALPPTATAGRFSEFQGDEIGLVLRTLARQAGLNIVVSEKVVGTVTLRLENKSPREAIDVIVTSKGLVMDEQAGVLYVKTQEERKAEPTEAASFTLSYATAEKIAPLLASQLTSGTPPQFDIRTNTVFFRETKTNMPKIMLFLETIDRPTQQVMIEARLVEVTANPQQNYGINWAGVVGGSAPQIFRYGGSTTGTSTVEVNDGVVSVVPEDLPAVVTNQNGTFQPQDLLFSGELGKGFLDLIGGQFGILSAPQFSATLRLLNEDRDTEFIANPRIVTSSNQKATIKITRAQPVPQLTFNEQTAQAVFNGFQDKEFGNTLNVTPVVNKDNFISLLVQPEISNKVGDATFTFGGASVTSPIIDKRSLDSNVLIKSGDTLAIGGLLQDEVAKGKTKVPVLGDIPVVGYLFQERTNNRTKRNLLVFVTPTIVNLNYGTGLEDQITGLRNSGGEEFADPNGWRNNARGSARIVPTSNRQIASDYAKPGIPPAPKKVSRRR